MNLLQCLCHCTLDLSPQSRKVKETKKKRNHSQSPQTAKPLEQPHARFCQIVAAHNPVTKGKASVVSVGLFVKAAATKSSTHRDCRLVSPLKSPTLNAVSSLLLRFLKKRWMVSGQLCSSHARKYHILTENEDLPAPGTLPRSLPPGSCCPDICRNVVNLEKSTHKLLTHRVCRLVSP
jgi:hypothetical protein